MRGLALGLALCFGADPARAGVEVGLGGIGGGAVFEGDGRMNERPPRFFSPAGSPILSASFDLFEGSVRPVFGLTSAPTFVYSMGYDAYTAPIAVVDLGVTVGSERTRASVLAHAGWFSFGASARFTHTPWRLGQAHTGVEVRLGWVARWGGYAGALWTVRFL